MPMGNDKITESLRRLEQKIPSPSTSQVEQARKTLASSASDADSLREVLHALDLMPSTD